MFLTPFLAVLPFVWHQNPITVSGRPHDASAGYPLRGAGGTPADYVDPMIGATTKGDSAGKTFPGPATPFGLVQLSPDTVTGGDNGSGYSAENSTIEGFSFLHMSGVGWYGDFGNLQVMPETGDLVTGRDAAKSPFQKGSESAKAGYYSVFLDRYKTKVELTAAPHAGILRFTFPKSDQSRIKFDLYRRIGYTGGHSVAQYVKQVDSHTVEGWMDCNAKGGGWGNGEGNASYIVHFYLQTNIPISGLGTWDAAGGVSRSLTERKGTTEGFFIDFPTHESESVLVKSGISFVSMEGARKNLERDVPGWDFDKVRAQAKALWNRALGNVTAAGGTDGQKATFYTALYHTLIDPRDSSDVDGNFMGWDRKVHQARGFVNRTVFSGWDVYRAQIPLQTIINPSLVNDEVNSLLNVTEFGGCKGLARWEIVGEDSALMPGDAGVAVIADAYLKGIRGYDVHKAYDLVHDVVRGPAERSNRHGLSDWLMRGYVSGDLSNTLENAYDDYCAARFADLLGRKEDAESLYATSENYSLVWDPDVQWMHARQADGKFIPWHGLLDFDNSGCTESNPLQQGWFVPHDEAGLIKLMGGNDKFCERLNDFFEKTPTDFLWNPYCNHSNEPVHQCAYQFVYAGKPWLTQKWARVIATHAYGTGTMGIIGNEDVGQMSAWYVLSALGFYPACPADGVYIIGSPIFPKVTLRLDSHYYKGRTFTVIAHDTSDANVYVQSAKLNGKPLNRSWITHQEIVNGGTLEFQMGPQPNMNWGNAVLPPSLSTSGKPGSLRMGS